MITVFGSINVDLVLQVDTLPRPGETVLCPGYEILPGGKGANQALAAARADAPGPGAPVRMIGRVGRDGFADRALSLLREEGVDLDAVADSDKPTCCAAVCVDAAGENAIVVASGANRDAHAGQIAVGALRAADWLVLQMEIPRAETWRALHMAKQASAKTMLSVAPAAPVPELVLRDVDVLLVNRIEGETVARNIGLGAVNPTDLPAALARRFGLVCAMTLGADGIAAAGPDFALRVPALPVSVVDTTGAGDAFAGILAAALDEGLPTPLALRRASAGAALACTALGAQTALPDRDAILAAERDLPATQSLDATP